jgi:hypothetical protein
MSQSRGTSRFRPSRVLEERQMSSLLLRREWSMSVRLLPRFIMNTLVSATDWQRSSSEIACRVICCNCRSPQTPRNRKVFRNESIRLAFLFHLATQKTLHTPSPIETMEVSVRFRADTPIALEVCASGRFDCALQAANDRTSMGAKERVINESQGIVASSSFLTSRVWEWKSTKTSL